MRFSPFVRDTHDRSDRPVGKPLSRRYDRSSCFAPLCAQPSSRSGIGPAQPYRSASSPAIAAGLRERDETRPAIEYLGPIRPLHRKLFIALSSLATPGAHGPSHHKPEQKPIGRRYRLTPSYAKQDTHCQIAVRSCTRLRTSVIALRWVSPWQPYLKASIARL